jgi:hypothetical protein
MQIQNYQKQKQFYLSIWLKGEFIYYSKEYIQQFKKKDSIMKIDLTMNIHHRVNQDQHFYLIKNKNLCLEQRFKDK